LERCTEVTAANGAEKFYTLQQVEDRVTNDHHSDWSHCFVLAMPFHWDSRGKQTRKYQRSGFPKVMQMHIRSLGSIQESLLNASLLWVLQGSPVKLCDPMLVFFKMPQTNNDIE
jgi:hypothetical protein